MKRQRLMPVNDTDDSSSAPSSRSGGEPHRTDTETLTGVEERLSSMETHMNLKKGVVCVIFMTIQNVCAKKVYLFLLFL